jgi:biopolymer transport protein ExbD
MRVRRARKREWQLAFASMSDIAFLLIIFFAVAGKFTKTTQQDIALPPVDLGERTVPRELDLVVTKDGTYLFKGLRVEPDALKDELSSYIYEDTPEEDRHGRPVCRP